MISNFIDAMTRMPQFYHYCLMFMSPYIGFIFIPAAELRGIQINNIISRHNKLYNIMCLTKG
jgi:hypothetical protein